ncbi:hypothetical protein GOBAR_DD12631 [Gossypium barbadense]|nr:hypothetical protein GOBAR_DD12631 [Gossypium barbadense]
MDAKFLVCVYFDRVILTTSVGCVFECRQQIAMRFNRNVSFDEMKAMINAKIHRRCGRRISKIFYKFPVSTNPVKFVEMELVDDEGVETMVDLYCGNGSEKNAPIHLFAELVGMEQNASDEEDGAEEPRMVAPISYVDSESTMGGIGIDLNITADVDMVGGEEEGADEEEGGGDNWDEEVDSDADLNVGNVPDDIDAENVNNDEGINASSVGEQMRCIVIHNNPRPHMSLIDPDAAYVSEFPEYPEIVHSHGLAVTSDDDELFIGQRFSCKEECVYAIKRYSMKISVDYKVSVSTPTIYVGECWKAAEGCNWWVRAAFIRSSQMWEIRKFVGPHICTSTRMSEDHGKLDSKTICTCIMLMVKDMPTIRVSVGYVDTKNGGQQVDQIQAGHVFVEHVRDAMVINRRLARSYGVDLRNRRCECRKFETLHYPCAHVVAACAKVNLNAEQYVDDVYTLERTLRVWENEFPVLPDLSTWEVPPITFELFPDAGLRKNPRGRSQSSRIRNEMDIREKFDGKRYGICRLSGHSRNKCLNRNFHVGQSSGSGRN